MSICVQRYPLKKTMNLVFQLLVMLQIAYPAFGDTSCTSNDAGEDICMEAKRISDEIAKQLPLQMSDDMIWESVVANKNGIQGELHLSYDRKTFKKLLLETGLTMERAESRMREAALMVCAEGSPTRSFIDKGGVMRYDYRFLDGARFLVVEIANCD